MASYDEAKKAVEELTGALGALEAVRGQWAKKIGMESYEDLNAVQAEHSTMMPLHAAMLRDNPAAAASIQPQMDKMTAKVGQVAELKSAMGMIDTIAAAAIELAGRARAVAASTAAALNG